MRKIPAVSKLQHAGGQTQVQCQDDPGDSWSYKGHPWSLEAVTLERALQILVVQSEIVARQDVLERVPGLRNSALA